MSTPFPDTLSAAGTFPIVEGPVELRSYATVSLPSATALPAGTMVYDSTLQQPKITNGTVWSSVGGGTLAQTYANGTSSADSTMSLDTTRGAVTLKDAVSPMGTTFQVVSNDGTATRFGVHSWGIEAIGQLALNSDSIGTHGITFQATGINSYDDNYTALGFNTYRWSDVYSVTFDASWAFNNTYFEGITLKNTRGAAANVTGDDGQRYSQALTFIANGWKTNAPAGSVAIKVTNYVKPVQGTTAPSANLCWYYDVAGAYEPTNLLMQVSSLGSLQLPDGVNAAVSEANTGALRYNNTTKTWQYSVDTGAWTSFGSGSGTVTSVGLSLPAIFTVTNSPVTTTGTLTGTLATQTANTVWAGPTTGADAAPTFRSLVAADIPSLSGTYLPLAGGSMGGTINWSADNSYNIGDSTHRTATHYVIAVNSGASTLTTTSGVSMTGTAVAQTWDTTNALTAGDKWLSVKSAGTEKAYFDLNSSWFRIKATTNQIEYVNTLGEGIQTGSGSVLVLVGGASGRYTFSSSRFSNNSDNSYDIGASSLRFANTYTVGVNSGASTLALGSTHGTVAVTITDASLTGVSTGVELVSTAYYGFKVDQVGGGASFYSTGTSLGAFALGANGSVSGVSGTNNWINQVTNNRMVFYASSNTFNTSNTSAFTFIHAGNTNSDVLVTMKGQASQTGNLLNFRDSSDNLVASVGITGTHTASMASIGTGTSTIGFTAQNPTAAANAAQQFSPGIEVKGAVYNSSAAASQAIGWSIQAKGVQRAGTPYTYLAIQGSSNGSAYSDSSGAGQGGTLIIGDFSSAVASAAASMVYVGNNYSNGCGIQFGQGVIQLFHGGANPSYYSTSGVFRSYVDNVTDLGSSGARFANVYGLNIGSGSSDLTLTPNAAVVPSANNSKNMGSAANKWQYVFSYGFVGVVKTYTTSGAVTVNPVNNGEVLKLTANGNVTSLTVSTCSAAQIVTLVLIQDGAGTSTWPSTITNVKLAGGSFSKSTGAGQIDSITLRYDDAGYYYEIARTTALS